MGYISTVFSAYRQPFLPSFVLPRDRGCEHAASQGCLSSFKYYHRPCKTWRLLTRGLGQREMGWCGEMVNVNLNRGGNVIISKSAEPSRPGGRAVDGHFTSRACRAERPGHDCQSHPEDLRPPPPNSVSACRLIKVSRIEEFVWKTWPKSMSWFLSVKQQKQEGSRPVRAPEHCPQKQAEAKQAGWL